MMFQKATKKQARLRLAFCGPSGSGKTYTALRVACALAKAFGTRVALVDTERGSASKYADEFDFDVCELQNFHPQAYIDAARFAANQGYGVLVFDSLSHAWAGPGGALELKDQATARSRSGNDFAAWREVTPLHNALVETMLQSPCHLIATMRTKTEWVLERNDKGKMVPRKVGTQPVQRAGMEYEFDVVGDLDDAHTLAISKSRCRSGGQPLFDRAVIRCPGDDFAETLRAWLTDGERVMPTPAAPTPQPTGNNRQQPATTGNPPAKPNPGRPGFEAHLMERLSKHNLRIEDVIAWATERHGDPLAWRPDHRANLVNDLVANTPAAEDFTTWLDARNAPPPGPQQEAKRWEPTVLPERDFPDNERRRFFGQLADIDLKDYAGAIKPWCLERWGTAPSAWDRASRDELVARLSRQSDELESFVEFVA